MFSARWSGMSTQIASANGSVIWALTRWTPSMTPSDWSWACASAALGDLAVAAVVAE